MNDDVREIRHFHMACGLGGGAKGFNLASPRAGGLVGKMRCVGGVDVDPAAIRDFERASGTKGTVLDLFSREQYTAFHGKEPPHGWHETTPADLRRAAGNERPHIVFASYPCKGNSGLLSETLSRTGKYQALNGLALRGTWLMLEAWGDDPPELILFENVPRIVQRSRVLLDQIAGLLGSYGYAVAETAHDCGELGGLAQSRKRFLMVARHIEKVPPFLYEPDKKRLLAVGDVLGRMPLPGDTAGGPMHRIPRLQWKTWVRLAFVEAGADWRSLQQLAVVDGALRDFVIVPDMRNGVLGVHPWTASASTVAGESLPTNGAFSVADPRFEQSARWSDGQAYGSRRWDASMGTIGGQQNPGQGSYTVADPRFASRESEPRHCTHCYHIVRLDEPAPTITSGGSPSNGGRALADPRLPPSDARHYNLHRVSRWDEPANCVTGAQQVGSGAPSVADPRCAAAVAGKSQPSKYGVTPYDAPSNTVIGGSTTGQGAFAVADPRVLDRKPGDAYLTGGHYGVIGWDQSSGAISAAGGHDNGRWSVADPRCMPAAADKLVAVIRALDGTWHRPFTTFELAALQSLVEPEEQLELDGLSDQAWRERIGNAVPPKAAQAVAEVMGTTLLLAWSGETFMLSSQAIWVRPIAVALAVERNGDTAPRRAAGVWAEG
jgi:site-specific DNA-cytosine methylase